MDYRGLNILEEVHWYGIRLWGTIQLSEKVTVNVSPLGYFYEIPPTYDRADLHQWQDELRFSLRVRLASESGLISHRYGLERRFRRNYREQYWQEYRVRYMLRFNKEITNGYNFIMDDEIFLNMGKDIAYNIFDANRFFLGVRKEVLPQFSITVGYQNILELLSSGDEFNVIHVLNVTCSLRSTLSD